MEPVKKPVCPPFLVPVPLFLSLFVGNATPRARSRTSSHARPNHSLEAVDRYLGQYDRVRHCRLEGLTPEQTAHALGCGLPLVREYLAIDDLLEKKRG